MLCSRLGRGAVCWVALSAPAAALSCARAVLSAVIGVSVPPEVRCVHPARSPHSERRQAAPTSVLLSGAPATMEHIFSHIGRKRGAPPLPRLPLIEGSRLSPCTSYPGRLTTHLAKRHAEINVFWVLCRACELIAVIVFFFFPSPPSRGSMRRTMSGLLINSPRLSGKTA